MLFLAGLAVVMEGFKIDSANSAASIFLHAAGDFGYKFFGLLLFASGMSSILGSTFTSTSFLDYAVNERATAIVLYFIGNPANVLVLVGALNGFVLPIALTILLVAVRKRLIMGKEYHHPAWLTVTGWLVVIFMTYASVNTLIELFSKINLTMISEIDFFVIIRRRFNVIGIPFRY